MPNKHTILIVEEHERTRLAYSGILSKEGYEVLLADDGEKALELLKENKVNVILSDLKVPRLDGLQLLKASKLIKPRVGVILLMSFETIESENMDVVAMENGAYDVIIKPIEIITLVNTIRKAIDEQALKYTVLIVDEEESVRRSLSKMLSVEGYEVLLADGGEKALEILREKNVCLMLLDVKVQGLQLLKASKLIKPDVQVILIVSHGTVEKAVEAMKNGAYDFIERPFDETTIMNVINKAIETQSLLRETKLLREQLVLHERAVGSKRDRHIDIIGQSDAMLEVVKLAEQVAPSQAPVLIQGENGTGKETIACFIQKTGQRSDKPFIKISFANVPDSQLECDLFGNEDIKTGKTIKGCLELANKGTLFLDEIEEVSPYLQAKLLRVLQEKTFRRQGGNKVLESDVSIISSTNSDFASVVNEKKFREDLYYLLNIVTINIPPLRERMGDIPPLISHFLKVYKKKQNKIIDGVSEDALDILSNYHWPGNIDELKNVIQKAVVLTQDRVISKNDLLESIVKYDRVEKVEENGVFIPIGTKLEEMEKELIKKTLSHAHGNREKTARILGTSERTLYRKIDEYGLK